MSSKDVNEDYEDLLEKQSDAVDLLYDQIDLIESEYDYTFVEEMVEKVAAGNRLTDNQWNKVQVLAKRLGIHLA